MPAACFTGHRKIEGLYYDHQYPSPHWSQLRSYLIAAITGFATSGTNQFISGMAIGVDQLAVECVHSARGTVPHISIVAAIPFPSQPSNWPPATQQHYATLLDFVDDVHVISEDPYAPQKMHLRDEWMVNASQFVIAIWDGRPQGGTHYTLNHALQNGKPVFVINPLSSPIEGSWLNPQ